MCYYILKPYFSGPLNDLLRCIQICFVIEHQCSPCYVVTIIFTKNLFFAYKISGASVFVIIYRNLSVYTVLIHFWMCTFYLFFIKRCDGLHSILSINYIYLIQRYFCIIIFSLLCSFFVMYDYDCINLQEILQLNFVYLFSDKKEHICDSYYFIGTYALLDSISYIFRHIFSAWLWLWSLRLSKYTTLLISKYQTYKKLCFLYLKFLQQPKR